MIWRNLIELDIITHPFFLLHCHLVVSVMYRRLAFDDDISNETKPILSIFLRNINNISLEERNYDIDHVHICFKEPHTQISKFINADICVISSLISC